MLKYFIGIIIALLLICLIWLYKNKNVINKVIKCTLAHFYVMNDKAEDDEINGVIKINENPPDWVKRLDEYVNEEENIEFPKFFQKNNR